MKIKVSHFKRLTSKNINRITIKSVSEYLEYIKFIYDHFDSDILWYRGVTNSNYKLVPSIFRKDIWDYNEYEEKNITSSFIHRAKGFIKNDTSIGKWEWYQIMQHYGLPTRLLDWTEGNLIALYFAVRTSNNKSTSSVWVLNPVSLNYLVTNIEGVFYTDLLTKVSEDKITEDYMLDYSSLPKYPISIIPPYSNDRMSSQKSCFTIHGKIKYGFENLHKKFDNFHLVQLKINQNSILQIRKELLQMGIGESTLFPDLEGLSRELKYIYKMK